MYMLNTESTLLGCLIYILLLLFDLIQLNDYRTIMIT